MKMDVVSNKHSEFKVFRGSMSEVEEEIHDLRMEVAKKYEVDYTDIEPYFSIEVAPQGPHFTLIAHGYFTFPYYE